MLTMTERDAKFTALLDRIPQFQNPEARDVIYVLESRMQDLETATKESMHTDADSIDFINELLLVIAGLSLRLIECRSGISQLAELKQRMFDVQHKKGMDYGEEADGLRNLRRRGIPGVVARMGDKMTRLDVLTKPGRVAAVSDESVEDTALDLANYCLLLIILIEDLQVKA